LTRKTNEGLSIADIVNENEEAVRVIIVAKYDGLTNDMKVLI
jgi:hypothetical protein